MIRSADVARHLAADPSLVARWVRRGMPLTSLPEALAWHAATIRPRNRLPPPAEPDRASAPAAPSGSMSAQLLEARLKREQADAFSADLRARELAGTLVKVDDVTMAHASRVARMRDALRGIPARLAALLAAEADAGAVQRMLQVEIDGAMYRAVGDADAA